MRHPATLITMPIPANYYYFYLNTLINQCTLAVTLNFDLSRSIFLYEVNAWLYIFGTHFRDIYSFFAEI